MTTHSSTCRVWSRFEATRKDGTVLKLRIQEAPSHIFEQVIEFNKKYFITGENILKCSGVASNPESLAEYQELIKKAAKSWSICICCEDNDGDVIDKILGVSTIHLHKAEPPQTGVQFKTKEMRKVFEVIMGMEKLYTTPFDIYHEGRGIGVHPEYRGLGIATEFVKVRRLMINEENIPMTCAWMTSYGSQKAAEKDNWITAFEISTKEVEERFDVTFENAPLTFKLMLATNSINGSKEIKKLCKKN